MGVLIHINIGAIDCFNRPGVVNINVHILQDICGVTYLLFASASLCRAIISRRGVGGTPCEQQH